MARAFRAAATTPRTVRTVPFTEAEKLCDITLKQLVACELVNWKEMSCFVVSVQGQNRLYGGITEKQREGVENILRVARQSVEFSVEGWGPEDAWDNYGSGDDGDDDCMGRDVEF